MNQKALEIEQWFAPHNVATQIANYWSEWNTLREPARSRWKEIYAYIHASKSKRAKTSFAK